MPSAYTFGMADTAEEPKKGSKKMLIFALIGFNVVTAAAAGYFVLGSQAEEEEEDEEVAEETPTTPEGQFGPLVEMKPLVGNLDDPDAGRYVKIKLHFEITKEELRPMMETAMVPIRSELLVYFTGIKVADTIGTANKLKIMSDVQRIAQKVVGEGMVNRVFFTEFVTQ